MLLWEPHQFCSFTLSSRKIANSINARAMFVLFNAVFPQFLTCGKGSVNIYWLIGMRGDEKCYFLSFLISDHLPIITVNKSSSFLLADVHCLLGYCLRGHEACTLSCFPPVRVTHSFFPISVFTPCWTLASLLSLIPDSFWKFKSDHFVSWLEQLFVLGSPTITWKLLNLALSTFPVWCHVSLTNIFLL